jgi:DNA-binding response OmpR family regulator
MPDEKTVLLIDDDPNVRESLQLVLEDMGYRVLTAAEGLAGIRQALSSRPDLIITDMMMPKTSGFIVIETLKHQHGISCPIIMLTGNDGDHQKTYAEFLGADAYVIKPVRPAALFELLTRFCPNASTAPAYAS